MSSNRIGNAFFENGSWYHRTKILNDDYSTTYSKKGGFSTAEEAEKSYQNYKEEYEKKLAKHLLIIDEDILFSDYLIYWYENIFMDKKPENTYILGVSYVIYNMIIPFLRQNSNSDIKMKLLNTNYLDSLLEELSKITDSAGNKCQEVLNVILNDAKNNGHIVNNPLQGTNKYPRKTPKVNILTKKELKELLLFSKEDSFYLEILLGVFCRIKKTEKFLD